MKSNTLIINKQKKVTVIKFPHFEVTRMVNHGFSTKHGGMSKGVFATMNLSKTRGDLLFNVEENFNRFSAAIGVDTESLVFSDQIHGSSIQTITKNDRGKGFYRTSNIIGIDGLVTNEAGITLTTFYADCVPLFFLDPIKRVIGLSHAGWRGTVKGIAANTVRHMQEHFQCIPKDILVGIGPSIGGCCYEVNEDVINEFEKIINRVIIDKIMKKTDDNSYLLNLWQANKHLLIEAGITDAHITVTDLCTKCYSDDFYSHRVMGENRGSLAAMLALKDRDL